MSLRFEWSSVIPNRIVFDCLSEYFPTVGADQFGLSGAGPKESGCVSISGDFGKARPKPGSRNAITSPGSSISLKQELNLPPSNDGYHANCCTGIDFPSESVESTTSESKSLETDTRRNSLLVLRTNIATEIRSPSRNPRRSVPWLMANCNPCSAVPQDGFIRSMKSSDCLPFT